MRLAWWAAAGTAIGLAAAAIAGVPGRIVGALENPGAPSHQGRFTEHVATAIQVNEQRRDVYSKMTGGKSVALSNELIGDEKITLILARYFDWAARKFNERGIPVVSGDFVDMVPARPVAAAPANTAATPAPDLKRLDDEMGRFQRDAVVEIFRGNFQAVADRAYALTVDLSDTEARTHSNLAMSRHLVDAVGYAALHAATYQKQSHGQTDNLDRQFLLTMLVPLKMGLDADRRAQAVQARGAGLFVNDLPIIPFREQYEAKRASAGAGQTAR